MTFTHWLFEFLVSEGVNSNVATFLNMLALLLCMLLIAFVLDYIARNILLLAYVRFAKNSKTKFDDLLVANKTPRYVAHIVPIMVIFELIPIVFIDYPRLNQFSMVIIKLVVIVVILWMVRSLLNTFKDFFKTLPVAKNKPIDSYVQVFMIFAWITGFMFSFAIISGMSIWKFFTILGTASAIIILIFRDTILGFVASIQVSINDMVRIGDWITFDKFGADGDVIEINLATVKVQNFDKTITTIPTYALISDSFKNWRGMVDSKGRRMKRAISLQKDSIRFMTAEDLERFAKISLVTDYISHRQNVIDQYNQNNNIDKSLAVNGRNLTNIGIFRKYIDAYLRQHPAINKEMPIMVRQLEPGANGIPLEIYAFCSDKRWEQYEHVMADIFDHILAAVPYFDLKLYEMPNADSFRMKA